MCSVTNSDAGYDEGGDDGAENLKSTFLMRTMIKNVSECPNLSILLSFLGYVFLFYRYEQSEVYKYEVTCLRVCCASDTDIWMVFQKGN